MELATLASFLGFIPPIAHFLYTPKLEVMPGSGDSFFGWTNKKQFALFLTVSFINRSRNPYLAENIIVYNQGSVSEPIRLHGNHISLFGKDGHNTTSADPQKSILRTPNIPPMDKVERWGFFHLPNPEIEFPTSLEFNVEAKYPFGRNQMVTARLERPFA